MTEVEIKDWLFNCLGVSRETIDTLDQLVALVREAQESQNLVAASTLPDIWNRHVRDSAQLLDLVPEEACRGDWVDLGSGAGFPGIVLAILAPIRMTLVESRRLRQDFLKQAIDCAGLETRVHVERGKVENMLPSPYRVITARAFAPLPRLFETAQQLADRTTIWLLPKGETVEKELAEAQRVWQGAFEMIPSITNPSSFIVRATDVRRRRRR